MDQTIQALEAIHASMLAHAKGPEHAQELMALAASVPHLAPLIEQRVPKLTSIMRPEDVRTLLVELAVELLRAQMSAVTTGATRAPRHARRGR